MKNINIKPVQVVVRKNRTNLIASIIFLVISLVLLIWAGIILIEGNPDSIYLHDLIANESIEENISVKVDLVSIPYAFAEYSEDDDSNKYYFLMDNDYLYVGYLDYKTYNKLESKNLEEELVTLEGITKKIPDDIIELAIQVYNREKGEVFLTEENYKLYIGEICLDTTEVTKNINFQIVFSFSSFIVGVAMGFLYLKQNHQIKKTISTYTDSEWREIEKQLSDNVIMSNNKMNIYFTTDYIVDINHGLHVLKYSDIVWVYPYQLKQYGLVINQSIIVYNQNGKKIVISSINSSSNVIHELINDFISLIIKNNSNVLVGYTKENCKTVKELYQIR